MREAENSMKALMSLFVSVILGLVTTLASSPSEAVDSIGEKTAIIIRLDFADRQGAPSTSTVDDSMNEMAAFFEPSSYGVFQISSWTTTPILRLTGLSDGYCPDQGYYDLRDEARALATANGYSLEDYDFEFYAFPRVPCFGWASIAYIGSKGAWLNGYFTWNLFANGVGHNLGLKNANRWYEDPPGTEFFYEYGDRYDLMGLSCYAPCEISAAGKSLLGWIPTSEIRQVVTSDTYRLYDLRKPIASGDMHALTFVVGHYGYTHWLDFRPSDLGQDYYDNAITVHWVRPGPGPGPGDDIALVDMVPETPTALDASLRTGSTFSDPTDDIHVTPIGRGGTDPDYMDVVINIGPFPGNSAPLLSLTANRRVAVPGGTVEFSATAEDPDGDSLVYEWTVVDSLYNNNPLLVHTWNRPPGIYPVTVVVSDMKGGSTSATLDYEVVASIPVPTLNEWGIFAVIAAMAGTSFAALRRRRTG